VTDGDSEPTVLHRFGNYEIMSLLGRGGMAEVYRARVLEGPRAGWQVAIKRLLPELARKPEYVDLFASEADLSKLLDHPYIVKVYDVGVIDETYFMAMELIDGRDVGQILRRCKQKGIPWPVDFAVYATRVLLEALSYAHNATTPTGNPLGIVHGDISPSNLFVSRTGDIKLGDFGVARTKAGGTDPKVLGKPYYLSPEVVDGTVTHEADLWAATVTLYELLTNDKPFRGANASEVFTAIKARLYEPLSVARPDASPELDAVVQRGFSIDPAERFATAAEMAAALIPLYDELVGTPLAIASVVRGLFGAGEARTG
jgi:eukaryotic-like serine/threonine-protein kinase